jgi:hypothetical protein
MTFSPRIALNNLLCAVVITLIFSCHANTPKEKPKQNKTEILSNSYEYRYKNSEIKYVYAESTQTHDYSGNWDFDGDTKKDSLLFIGEGGAHLFYHLKVVLSSNYEVYNYPWITTDFPLLDSSEKLSAKDIQQFPKFVVADFNKDSLQDIYVNISDGHNIPAEAKKNGISTPQVVIRFNGKLVVCDYSVLNSRK